MSETSSRRRQPVLSALTAAELLLFAGLLGWLVWAAVIIDVEYYDGWDAVSNARLFAGTAGDAGYVPNRAPMMSWLLLPSEALRQVRGGDPLDPRPYHLASAVLHGLYLLGVYGLLCKIRGRTWSSWLAFLLAVPSFVFFAYGPFLSHDIFPGLLLLAMVFWLGRWLEEPSWKLWAALVAVGAGAVLVKQTYALFWIVLFVAVVVSWLVPSWRDPDLAPQEMASRATWLAAGAALSAGIVWVALAFVLGEVRGLGDIPFFERPKIQFFATAVQTADAAPWLYLRNAPAFGLLTVLLLPLGLWRSRHSRRPAVRLAVVSLPLFLLAMQLIPLREVRYLLFLSPLAAVVVEPAVRRLLSRRGAALGLALILAFEWSPLSPWPRLAEATRLAGSFYRESPLRPFVQSIRENREGPVVWEGSFLSFYPPSASRLVGDHHHEIFHFGPHHLLALESLDLESLRVVGRGEAEVVAPGTVVVSSPGAVLRRSEFFDLRSRRWAPPGEEQRVTVGVGLPLRRSDDGTWRSPAGTARVGWTDGEPVLDGEEPSTALGTTTRLRLVADGRVVGRLEPREDGFVVAGSNGDGWMDADSLWIAGRRVVSPRP